MEVWPWVVILMLWLHACESAACHTSAIRMSLHACESEGMHMYIWWHMREGWRLREGKVGMGEDMWGGGEMGTAPLPCWGIGTLPCIGMHLVL